MEPWRNWALDGQEFRDCALIAGKMRQGWRLDAQLPYRLEDARDLGTDQALLVTQIVLALVLLVRALPEGRLQRFGDLARKVALLVLALLIVLFAAAQLRMALYPQLEGSIVQPTCAIQDQAADYEAAPAAPEEPPVVYDTPSPVAIQAPPPEAGMMDGDQAASAGDAAMAADAASDQMQALEERSKVALDKIVVTGSRIKRANAMDSYSQTTVVQAGRGLPNWRGGQSYQLSWGGPVTAEQSVRLLISPPWLTRLLRVLAVVALAWLLLRLSGVTLPKLPQRKAPALASLLLLSLIAAGNPIDARAASSEPDNQILQELRNRLTRAPKCAPECAAIAAARVDARDGQLQVTLDIHAQTRVGVPVPMDVKSLSLDSVQVDGVAVPGVARNDLGLSLPLERGVHRVQLSYRISGDRVALAFPMAPHAIEFSGDGWQATGITDARLLTETLSLNRLRSQSDERNTAAPAQEFPPYARVERTITLGLDWTVSNVVHRVAPKVGGFSVKLPVITGERVLTPGLLVRKGLLEIPLPDGADSASLDATLDKAEQLSLRAGSTQAIDKVQLQSSVGQRASEYTLNLQLRASQGGERVLTLPEKAELLAVTRNGESLNLRLERGKLSLPVQPGEQQYQVRFRDDSSIGMHNRTPAVALGLPAANIELGLSLPDNRWVLATHGPQSGPAVLYWGELLVLLLVAYGLSKLGWTPLKLRDWLFLGIGFSTFSWIALAVVVAWLFALAWRERQGATVEGKFRFDAMQVLLAGLSLAAAIALITAIPYGLLGRPDMHIVNPIGSDGVLRWFADQSNDALPQAGAISLPMWLYRAAMLAWALWRWGLRAWIKGGYWRPLRKPKVASTATPPIPPASR